MLLLGRVSIDDYLRLKEAKSKEGGHGQSLYGNIPARMHRGHYLAERRQP